MNVPSDNDRRESPIGALVVGGIAFYVMQRLGLRMGTDVIYPPAAFAGFVGMAGVAKGAGFLLERASDSLEMIAAKIPTGRKGSAKWATWRSLRRDVLRYGWGPFWGVYAGGGRHSGKPIFAEFASNALTVGPAGSGKGVGVVLPTCMAIRESKLILDFKGSNICMLKKPLEKRAEVVRILNLGSMHTQLLGESDCYNPLHILTDDFMRRGGLRDISSDMEEFAHQLESEPPEGGGEDKYWRDGSREFLGGGTLQSIMTYGPDATLGHVSRLLDNRKEFLKDMLWASERLVSAEGEILPAMPLEESPWAVSGLHDPEDVREFIKWYRNKAGAIADLLQASDSKTAESFLTSARQSLAVFNSTSRAAKVLSRSTFRFGDMKEGDRPTTVALVIDASRIATQSKVAALIQWCAFTEFKRHSNTSKPVYIIADETSNFKIEGLPSLQTWGREYGIRWHGFIQSISAYRTTYGKEALNVLLSETEIKQFLPGQREPEILDLIEKLLGQKATMEKSHNGKNGECGVSGFGLSEGARPLMTADEIRRTDKAILFIRSNRPVLTDLPPIAAIHPWRKQIGNNPFYGKPFLLPIKLRIGSRKPPLLVRIACRLGRMIARRKI